MKKSNLIIFALLCFQLGKAQSSVKTLKIDINANNVIDIIKPQSDRLELNIDNLKKIIPYELLGFENLYTLDFKNNVLTLEGSNEGTGMYTSNYKFRNNIKTNKIELIGYEYGYKWPTGNILKSYNALTGKFKVDKSELNPKTEKFDSFVYTGKKVIKKIILTEINETALKNLFSIGQEYEPQ